MKNIGSRLALERFDRKFRKFVIYVREQFSEHNKQFAYQNKLLEKLVGQKEEVNIKLDNHETRIESLEEVVLPIHA